MAEDSEAVLQVALTEGIVSREEANALREEARRLDRSPVALLVERGRISEDTFASLRAAAARRVDDPDEAAHVGAAPGGQDASSEAPDFPIPAWDRYQPVRFLGQGGMGRVFLARDPRLHRDVALKFVRGDDPELTRRFIFEARAQARVNHERVCKVYEVGEAFGRVYIAMQYVDGRPLGALVDELTLEQKATVIRAAAEGAHEAHRAGILHRDIKPSNIMVERAEDGSLRPYVMDFGLARSFQEGVTATGDVLGTPHYMAPEQARGEVGTLDRRADVYSLGATLYSLLLGQPPIPGENGLEVLNNIAVVEPRPPRAINRDIPVDLEAIVLKCLEKDRSARYDSARALAEDLERFLSGEPVEARSAGVWYRLRKRARKHRRLVTVVSIATLLVVIALGWGIQARREVAERERLARRFTETVERVESMARYWALSPRHDIRGDKLAIRAKMAELAGEIRGAGPLAAGPGEYALGRGYLALDDEDKAREHLESAWQRGFREPRVAYALALVVGHLYQKQLLEAERIRSDEQREARKRDIERRYRDPALAYLKQSEGAEVPSAEYVAALIAFYENRLDEALGHLDAIGGGLPWFYEAPALRGDILLARAQQHRMKGERDLALGDFESGRRAYAAASAVGESVPAVYEAMGELEYGALVMELYGQGDVSPPFTRGVEATGRALAVLPDHYASLVLEARLHRSLAEHRSNKGGNVDDLLTRAVADAERALALAPARPEARLELARAHRQWGEYRQSRSQDPGEQLRKAIAISEGIAPGDRDYDFHVHLGLIYKVWADYQDRVSVDSQVFRGKAIDAYREAIQRNDRFSDVWINLGINYFMRASQPRAGDPEGDLGQAITALDKARALSPKHIVPYFYEGQIHEQRGLRQRAHGGDARPELATALARYQEGSAINPSLPHLHNGAGGILIDQAREAWDRGGDPDPLLAEARKAFEQAITVAPEQSFGYHNVGEALVQRAGYQRARGEDPSATASEAIVAIQKAIDRAPDDASPWANLGTVHAIVAAYELDQGHDPRPRLLLASAAIEKALAKNPGDAQSQRWLGETRGMRARYESPKEPAGEADFEAAAQAFEKAISLAPDDPDPQVAFGHLCRAWASWQKSTGHDPGPSLRRGLDLAKRVLATRPALAEALILHGSLLLAQAAVTTLPDEQARQAGQALLDFSKALAANPNLERVWRSQAGLAQRLAAALQ